MTHSNANEGRTPYTIREKDGAWVAHALAFDLVCVDLIKDEAIRKLKTCLGAQIAFGKKQGLSFRQCFFPAPTEYWNPPYEFMPIPSEEELDRYQFSIPKPVSHRIICGAVSPITSSCILDKGHEDVHRGSTGGWWFNEDVSPAPASQGDAPKSREQFVEQARKLGEVCEKLRKGTGGMIEYLVMAAFDEGRDSLRSERGGWISVEERFPPRHHNVLYLNKDGSVFEGRICMGIRTPFFTYPRVDGITSNTAPSWINVTHWMPLPAPPASGKEGGWFTPPRYDEVAKEEFAKLDKMNYGGEPPSLENGGLGEGIIPPTPKSGKEVE